MVDVRVVFNDVLLVDQLFEKSPPQPTNIKNPGYP
jgi:hypothetical protein